MFGSMKLALVAMTIGAGLVAGGFATDAAQAADSAKPAVACPKCEVTWVKTAIYGKAGRVVGYVTHKQDTCPDCRAAITNFVNTGKFQHTCKACGDTMTDCVMHEAK